MLWTHQEIQLEKTIFNKRIVTIFLSAVPFTNHILLLNQKLISLHPRNKLRSLPACQHHIATKANPELCEDAPDHPDGSVAACLTPPPPKWIWRGVWLKWGQSWGKLWSTSPLTRTVCGSTADQRNCTFQAEIQSRKTTFPPQTDENKISLSAAFCGD